MAFLNKVKRWLPGSEEREKSKLKSTENREVSINGGEFPVREGELAVISTFSLDGVNNTLGEVKLRLGFKDDETLTNIQMVGDDKDITGLSALLLGMHRKGQKVSIRKFRNSDAKDRSTESYIYTRAGDRQALRGNSETLADGMVLEFVIKGEGDTPSRYLLLAQSSMNENETVYSFKLSEKSHQELLREEEDRPLSEIEEKWLTTYSHAFTITDSGNVFQYLQMAVQGDDVQAVYKFVTSKRARNHWLASQPQEQPVPQVDGALDTAIGQPENGIGHVLSVLQEKNQREAEFVDLYLSQITDGRINALDPDFDPMTLVGATELDETKVYLRTIFLIKQIEVERDQGRLFHRNIHIGRNSTDIGISNLGLVSGRHLDIESQAGGIKLVDLQSKNGTYCREISEGEAQSWNQIFLSDEEASDYAVSASEPKTLGPGSHLLFVSPIVKFKLTVYENGAYRLLPSHENGYSIQAMYGQRITLPYEGNIESDPFAESGGSTTINVEERGAVVIVDQSKTVKLNGTALEVIRDDVTIDSTIQLFNGFNLLQIDGIVYDVYYNSKMGSIFAKKRD